MLRQHVRVALVGARRRHRDTQRGAGAVYGAGAAARREERLVAILTGLGAALGANGGI